MRWPLALGLLGAAAILMGSATAATESIFFEIRDDGFHVGPDGSPNPMVRVEPGARLLVRAHNNASSPHNLHFGAPLNVATSYAQRPGEWEDLVVDVPAEFQGDVRYYSDADPSGFGGVLRVGKVYPSVRILDLQANQQVPSTLVVRIALDHFTLEPFPNSTLNAEGRGHVVWLLDGERVGGPTDRTTWTFANLTEGAHLVRVELVNRDATPVEPRANDERVVFHARAPPTMETPTPAPGTPNDTPFIGAPIALAIALVVALVIAPPRRRGP